MFGGAERGTATRHELTRSSEGQALKTAKAESFLPPAWFNLSSLHSFPSSGICTRQVASSASLIRSKRGYQPESRCHKSANDFTG